MKTLFIRFILLVIIVFTSSICKAQPSFSVHVKFQLADENGLVDFNRFCEEYQVFYYNWKGDLSPCENGQVYKASFYIDSIQSFRLQGTVVYNDFIWALVRNGDTMVMECPSFGGHGLYFELGYLEFREGFYRAYENSLDTFDLRKGRYDYFNQLAAQINADKEYRNDYQSLDRYKLFIRLLRYYGFPEDDWRQRELADF